MLTSLLTLQAIYISQGQGNQLSQVNPFTPPLRSRKESNESLPGWSQRAGLCQSTSLKKKWSSSTVFVGTALRNSLLSIRCSGARARPWRAGCWGAVTQAHPKPADEGWRFHPSAAFLHPRLCHLQVGRPPRPPLGPRLWCCGGRSRRRLSHVPAPGTWRREQEPGGPLPKGWLSGSSAVPVRQLPPAPLLSVSAALGFLPCSCALHIRRDFSEKSEISKNKDNWTHFVLPERLFVVSK